MSAPISSVLQSEGLRERIVTAENKGETESITPSSEEDALRADDDVVKETKTFGRTPDGTSEFSSPWERARFMIADRD
jgi:hypothetical protein